jgi:hypothetical protein
MFLVNSYAWEWTTIAALIAPRPLLFANSDQDPMFPMDGNHRVMDRLRMLYGWYGHPDRLAEHVSPGGHAYRPDLRMAVFQFLNTSLKGDASPVEDVEGPEIEGRKLRAFTTDQDLPRNERNTSIDKTFVETRRPAPPRSGQFDNWKRRELSSLKAASFRGFPETIPPARAKSKDGAIQILETEPGIDVRILQIRKRSGSSHKAMLIVLNSGEQADAAPAWATSLFENGEVWLLEPRGVGASAWTPKSPPNYVERAHALIGRTVDDGRVWDVAASMAWLRSSEESRREWTLLGSRQAGVIAAAASWFGMPVAEIVFHDPPVSFHEGPFFLNILQVTELPEALGLLAPTPIRLISGRPESFESTRAIFETAGASDAIRLQHPTP